MPRVKENTNYLKAADRASLKVLEKECDRLISALLSGSYDEAVSRRLREIEIKIVALTGEKTIDY